MRFSMHRMPQRSAQRTNTTALFFRAAALMTERINDKTYRRRRKRKTLLLWRCSCEDDPLVWQAPRLPALRVLAQL